MHVCIHKHARAYMAEVNGDTMRRALRRITIKGESKCVVVMVGSALKNKGVQPLMDTITWVSLTTRSWV